MPPLAIQLLIAAAADFISICMQRYRGAPMALDVQHAVRTELFGSLLPSSTAPGRTEISTASPFGQSYSDLDIVQADRVMIV